MCKRKKNVQNIQKDKIKQSNIHVIKFPDNKEKKKSRTEEIFKELFQMTQFPKTTERQPQMQEAQRDVSS